MQAGWQIQLTGASISYGLCVVGGLLLLGTFVRAGYYSDQIDAFLKTNVIVNGVLLHNAIVDASERIVLDYKERPLINLRSANDGTVLFHGQPIVIRRQERLYSLHNVALSSSPNGHIYTPNGSMHRRDSPLY